MEREWGLLVVIYSVFLRTRTTFKFLPLRTVFLKEGGILSSRGSVMLKVLVTKLNKLFLMHYSKY